MLDREGGGVTQSAKANANSEKTAKKADFVNSNSTVFYGKQITARIALV